MMDYPLTLHHFLERAAKLLPEQGNRHAHGRRYASLPLPRLPPARRTAWRTLSNNWGSSQEIASARFAGTPISTWNFISRSRATAPCLHTLNLRLSPDDLAYIINHAEDRVIFRGPIAGSDSRQRSATAFRACERVRRHRRRWQRRTNRCWPLPLRTLYPWPHLDENSAARHVLHLRHHRKSQRRGLQPSRAFPAQPVVRHGRHVRA